MITKKQCCLDPAGQLVAHMDSQQLRPVQAQARVPVWKWVGAAWERVGAQSRPQKLRVTELPEGEGLVFFKGAAPDGLTMLHQKVTQELMKNEDRPVICCCPVPSVPAAVPKWGGACFPFPMELSLPKGNLPSSSQEAQETHTGQAAQRVTRILSPTLHPPPRPCQRRYKQRIITEGEKKPTACTWGPRDP